MRRRHSGFTILEILIVFVLLAGIMAFVGMKIWDQKLRVETDEAKIRLLHMSNQIEMYHLDMGRYPSTLTDLVKQPASAERWRGPYVKEDEVKDKWGNDYKYSVPGTQGRRFDLVSLGADGKEGGERENRDISN